VNETIFSFVDEIGKPVKIEVKFPDGRIIDLQPTGEISRGEARDLCGCIINLMRSVLCSDQFKNGNFD